MRDYSVLIATQTDVFSDIATTATAYLTGNTNGQFVTDVLIGNTTSSAVTVTVSLYDGTADHEICKDVSINANSSYTFDLYIELKVDHELRIKAGTANALNAFVNYIDTPIADLERRG